MARFSSPLDNVRVAAPCTSDWNRMVGDERVRFCAECSLNVYNLSSMSRREAERLISNAEGRLCVRYYRRPDGTILTDNCPVGLRAIRRRLSRAAGATLSAVLGFFAGLGIWAGLPREEVSGVNPVPISTSVGTGEAREVGPGRAVTGMYPVAMGDVVVGETEGFYENELRQRPMRRVRTKKRR